MKKLFAKIISLAVATILSLFVLSGCELITVNAERDMEQVVATVSVDSALKEDIYKRELVSAYNNEGYYYVQTQSSTIAEAYEKVLDDLIKNRILKQQAILAFTEEVTLTQDETQKTGNYFKKAKALVATGDEAEISSYDRVLTTLSYNEANPNNPIDPSTLKKTDSLSKFFTEYEYFTIRYSILSSIDQFIDAYKDEEAEEHDHGGYEQYLGTARATLTLPTEELYNEYEMREGQVGAEVDVESDFFKTYDKINKDNNLGLNLASYTNKYDLSLQVLKTYCNRFTVTLEERSAVNKLIKDLKVLGFITEAEAAQDTPTTANQLLSLTYFNDALQIQYENNLISKFEKALQNEQEKALANDEALYQAYVNIFNTQKANYTNDYTAYETALNSASDSSLVFYNPSVENGKYGYVLNLLIGYGDEQNAIVTAINENATLSIKQKQDALDKLLTTLTAKDLRDSWVESNYGVYDKESNSFTFSDKYCKTEALRKFQGTLYGTKDYVYHDSYDIEQTGWTYKAVKATEIPFETFYSDIVSTIMGFTGKSGKLDSYTEDSLQAFKDLVFAYSTDPGSLADNYGYVYSPKTSLTTYVKEFADAAKWVVDNGVGSYKVVATEYGYHVLLCTKVIEPSNSEPMLLQEFTALANGTDKEALPYKFKEYQRVRLVEDNVNKITDSFFKVNFDRSVTKYEDKYKDLIEE